MRTLKQLLIRLENWLTKDLEFYQENICLFQIIRKLLHGSKDNKVVVDGNDLIINYKRYKGTHWFWKLLTNPNKNKLDKHTYGSWWTNKNNFTEKDLNLYKEIRKITYSIYQNKDPSTKNQSLVVVKSGTN
jgi:hypothetical protein